jgi:hypothetical protein
MHRYLMPINKTAALVTSKQSKDNEFNAGYSDVDVWFAPKKMKKVTSNNDLTGEKKGRLTILGRLDTKKVRWQVKCDCGKYASRTYKGWVGVKEMDCYMCQDCFLTIKVRIREFFRSYGRWPSAVEKSRLGMT